MADGGVSQIDYVVTNRTVTQAMVTDGRGNKTAHRFNTRSHEVAVVDALGQQTRMTRDFTTNQVMEVRDPLNRVTKFTYDAVGNLETVTDPLGNRSQRLYDAASRLTALIDPRGKTTQFTYDAVNQVTQIADALNGLTGFTYDPNGNLLTVADAKNQTTTYVYDNMDRLLTRTDALARSESYQYDLVGNLSRFTDRKNQQTNFVYDPLNRRTSTTYADSTSTTVAYDAVGNVTKLTDSQTGTIDRSYDVLDRVTQEVSPQGIVSYSYDVLSRRLSMRANALQPVTYSYDANSQLTQVAQGVINGVLTHDALERRTQVQRSNGVTTTYAYDPASRLAGLTHAKGATVLESLNYGLDQADNKTQVQQAQQQATALPPAVTAAYDSVNQQAQFAGANLAYDPNGNLTSDGTNTYVWDARDRLVGLSGGTTATFSYDALDRRLAKSINGATTTYLYDGADVVTEAGATNASYLSTLNIDEPLVRQTPSGNEYYHTDDLGSTVALSDDSGSITTRYTYGPFGSTTVTGSSTNSFQFTGRENDGTGLYYYRARYYSPSRSRFLSEDPLEFDAGDPNLYAYVSNSPTNLVDPSGEAGRIPPFVKKCVVGLIKAIAKIAGTDLAKRKPDVDPDDLLDAAKGCVGAGNKSGNTGASSATNRNNLNKSVGSQSQMSGPPARTIAGAGSDKPFRDADRAAKTYGGDPSDWAKKIAPHIPHRIAHDLRRIGSRI